MLRIFGVAVPFENKGGTESGSRATFTPHCRKAGSRKSRLGKWLYKSGRQDLNLRPSGPKPEDSEAQGDMHELLTAIQNSGCTTGCTSGPQNANGEAISAIADDSDLRLIVERWTGLPDVIKAGVTALILSVK